jgi:hypothetical protein
MFYGNHYSQLKAGDRQLTAMDARLQATDYNN